VRVVQGSVFDVAVDVTPVVFYLWPVVGYLSYQPIIIASLWVPEGFAHGFYVTSEYGAEFCVLNARIITIPQSEVSIKMGDDPV